MPTVKPRINVEDYLNSILDEHLDLDMTEDPEVMAEDPLERLNQADAWYESRMKILDIHERDAIRQLEIAVNHKFLEQHELYGAEKRVKELYVLLREQADERYEDVVGIKPQLRESVNVR